MPGRKDIKDYFEDMWGLSPSDADYTDRLVDTWTGLIGTVYDAREQERQQADMISDAIRAQAQQVGLNFEDREIQDYFWKIAAARVDEELGEEATLGEKIAKALERTQRFARGSMGSEAPRRPPQPMAGSGAAMPQETSGSRRPETMWERAQRSRPVWRG